MYFFGHSFYNMSSEFHQMSDKELEEIKRRMLERMMTPPKSSILKDGVVNVLTDANFDSAVASTGLPLLVDFWAEWCGPCRMMAPIIETLARDYAGKAYFAKINTDQNKAVSTKFRVMSIPLFILFRSGKATEQVLGAVGRGGLEALLRRNLST